MDRAVKLLAAAVILGVLGYMASQLWSPIGRLLDATFAFGAGKVTQLPDDRGWVMCLYGRSHGAVIIHEPGTIRVETGKAGARVAMNPDTGATMETAGPPSDAAIVLRPWWDDARYGSPRCFGRPWGQVDGKPVTAYRLIAADAGEDVVAGGWGGETDALWTLDLSEPSWLNGIAVSPPNPAYAGDRWILVGDASIAAAHASDGSLLWTAAVDGQVRCTPGIAGDAVVLTHAEVRAVRRTGKYVWVDWGPLRASAYRLEDGRHLWTRADLETEGITLSPGDSLTGPPAAGPDRVFMSAHDHDGSLFALDLATGATLWHAEFKAETDLIYATDRLCFGTPDALLALDPATGTELFRFDTDAPLRGRPLIAGGWAYFYDSDRRFYAVTFDVR